MKDNISKQTILVVDDAPDNIDVLRQVLRSEYKVKIALNGERALKIASEIPTPDMILLDVMMPGMDGYEVCKQLKSNSLTAAIPVIFTTAKNHIQDEQHGLELGAVDYIAKPIRPAIVLTRIKTHLALYDQSRHLEQIVKRKTDELEQTRLQIIQRLGRAAEFKDNETGLHVIRMSHYARLIAGSMSKGEQWVDLIFNAAPMHDIGKIGISDHVLLKPGKLDKEEWEKMQKHPEIGASIIGDHSSPLMQMSKEIALSHHEKWDGTGYPHGLQGEEIPLSARVVAIADVFDALTTERPYKKAWAVEDAINYINENAGYHFDPSLVQIFLGMMPEVIKIKARYEEPSA